MAEPSNGRHRVGTSHTFRWFDLPTCAVLTGLGPFPEGLGILSAGSGALSLSPDQSPARKTRRPSTVETISRPVARSRLRRTSESRPDFLRNWSSDSPAGPAPEVVKAMVTSSGN